MIKAVWQLLMQPQFVDCLYLRGGAIPPRGKLKCEQVIIDLLSENVKSASISELADFISRHTTEYGQACFIFENRCSVRAFMKRKRFGRGPAYSVTEVRRALKKKGFKFVDVYPLLPRGRNLFEIIFPVSGGAFPLSLKMLRRFFQQVPFLRGMLPAFAIIACRDRMPESCFKKIVRTCGIKHVERCIMGRPLSLIVISGRKVLRIPLDRLTGARNRINHHVLSQLSESKISSKVPVPVSKGAVCGYRYFCESRLKGYAYDGPVQEMDRMVEESARFLAHFQNDTYQRIKIDDYWWQILFEQSFNKLACYVDTAHAAFLKQLRDVIRSKVTGTYTGTVWCHGDYKVENVLFDRRRREIVGVIDWDLSRKRGLPLLDLFYLLIYRAGICSGIEINCLIKSIYLIKGFSPAEQAIIDDYLEVLRGDIFSQDLMLVMFWMDHILRRYRQQLECRREIENGWVERYVYPVIDVIYEQKERYYEFQGSNAR